MLRLILAGILSTVALSAQAQNFVPNFEFGAGLTRVDSELEVSDGAGNTVSIEDDSLATKFIGGYRFTPYFGLELNYNFLGELRGEIAPGVGADLDIEQISASALWTRTLATGVEVGARTGFARWDVEGAGVNAEEIGLLYGAFIAAPVGSGFRVRVEFEYSQVREGIGAVAELDGKLLTLALLKSM